MISTSKNFILFKYVFWYFIAMPKNILNAWGNILLFNLKYFSIKELLFSFFSHWKRDKASYGRGFDPKVWLNSFLSNMISRILGALMRLIVIIVGLLFEVALFLLGLLAFSLWVLFPFLFIFFFFYSFGLIL